MIEPNKKAIEGFRNEIRALESTIDNNKKLKFANDKQIDDIKRELLRLNSVIIILMKLEKYVNSCERRYFINIGFW